MNAHTSSVLPTSEKMMRKNFYKGYRNRNPDSQIREEGKMITGPNGYLSPIGEADMLSWTSTNLFKFSLPWMLRLEVHFLSPYQHKSDGRRTRCRIHTPLQRVRVLTPRAQGCLPKRTQEVDHWWVPWRFLEHDRKVLKLAASILFLSYTLPPNWLSPLPPHPQPREILILS